MNTLMLNNLNYKTQFRVLNQALLVAEYFFISAKIFAHIGIIVISAILKVSYVLRYVALHELGREIR